MLGGIDMNMLPKRFYLDNVFDSFFNENSAIMNCDIYEKDGNYHIEADIPGFKKEDLNVECSDGYLTITAEKANDSEEKDNEKNYIRRERVYGKIERRFYVGDVDSDHIKAEFKDGMLTLVVPKKEKSKNVINID